MRQGGIGRTIGSVRARLFAVVLLAAVPPLLMLLRSTALETERAKEMVRQEAASTVALLANDFTGFVDRTRSLTEALAGAPLLLDGSKVERTRVLKDTLAGNPAYLNVALVGADGRVLASALDTTMSPDYADRAWFQRAMATGRFAIGDYVIGKITKRPSLTCASPVRNSRGEPVGVVYASFDVAQLQRRLDAGALPPKSTAVVIDGNGTALARMPEPERYVGERHDSSTLVGAMLSGRTAIAELHGLDGVQRLYAYTPAASEGGGAVYVGVGMDLAAAYAPVQRDLRAALLALGAVETVAILLGWVASDRLIRRPLLSVSRAAERLAEGDLGARVDLPERNDEFGDLANGFDSMAASVQHHVERLESAHHDLDQLNHELDARVAERTEQLETANRELETFSYSVSHDLRAPLRAIQGFSAALLEEQGHLLDEQGLEHLGRIQRSAARMSQLIDSLLHLSRLGRHYVRRRPVDLTALAAELAEELRAADPAHTPTIEIEPELFASADPELTRVALGNLLGNAWKFTSRASDAHIEVGAIHVNGRRAFYVKDNGAGFDSRHANMLFGPFQRLHAEAEYPGLGVGLATVAKIVHRHGGEIRAEGRVGEGATFYFTLGDAA